jgi:outer membrane immunogenic protein
MKKTLVEIVALGALIGTPALASDMDLKAPPPERSWTGCYLGVQGGGSAAVDTGALAGGQLGCNYQIEHFVFGIEGEGAWSNATSPDDSQGFFSSKFGKNSNPWNADIAIRAGHSFPNDILAYLKVGAVLGRFESSSVYNFTFAPPYSTTANVTMPGLILGTGLEAMITPQWFARIELDALFFRSTDATVTCVPAAACLANFVPSSAINTITAFEFVGKMGISYRFK